MAKCPYCGSGDVKGLNVGRRILAGIASGATATVLFPFLRNGSKNPAMDVHKSICNSKKYICVNCGRKFEENIF